MVDKLIATDYCAYVATVGPDSKNPHVRYHNEEWGYPLLDDNLLFGRLILEINQAGLSWTTILNKHDAFHRAYDKFNVAKVASYGAKDRERLLADATIIRNRMKIDAAIHNAKVVQELQATHGSFHKWYATLSQPHGIAALAAIFLHYAGIVSFYLAGLRHIIPSPWRTGSSCSN
jgi:DNA-3-methyladenine glycosylase I